VKALYRFYSTRSPVVAFKFNMHGPAGYMLTGIIQPQGGKGFAVKLIIPVCAKW
jgi:hypothetical protein